MMILAVKAVILLSAFSFLGASARNLPEDIFRISNVDYGWRSSIASIIRPPRKSPPPPQVNPPIRPGRNEKNIRMWRIIGKTQSPPPPAPYVVPPRDEANSYQRWTLKQSHFSQQVLMDNEIIKRPYLSSPPPPHLAPPHIQKKI